MGAEFMVEMAGHALQVEAFARRFYTFFNERRFDEAEAMVDRQAVFSYPAAREHMIGRAGYRELVRRWLEGFPDGRVGIVAVHVGGDVAATELLARGTHTGVLELPGLPPIPPTGRSAQLPMRETITVKGGLIVSVKMEFDPGELRRVLGV
jgi:predicted ester cyclase